jgi:hypothetical protein
MGAEMVRGFGAPVGNSAGVDFLPSLERQGRGVSGEGAASPPRACAKTSGFDPNSMRSSPQQPFSCAHLERSMNITHSYRFWSPGPPEYILVKAGLFDVILPEVSPTKRLTRLLRPIDTVPDDLLPILVRMAECAAIELGGAIDTGALRSRLVSELRALGLRHEAIGDLFVLMTEGAAATAEERRGEGPFVCGTALLAR